ncbi:MAG: N-6 DNA methylase, partial [Treponema sp.]|nr:N-6 DNA methylase [Treponema sp.]
MPLSWNEIKTRSAAFALEWKERPPAREKADAQTFETEFLRVFGVERKKAALFEHEVRFGEGEGGGRGYIDLFWKGKIIIEMKTPGKDLDKAYEQAKAYALTLPRKDIPRGILISNFLNFQYYDLEDEAKRYSFRLDELPAHVELFGCIAGYREIDPYKHWDPVNIQAAETMGRLHDRLKETGYSGRQLELYLVRLLFCLFADDTGIFEPPNLFNKYLLERTGEDGSDLALHLQMIFETLNKPKESRFKTLDEELNRFPYINGRLFEEKIETAAFDRAMRDTLIECCSLDWSKISPAIFGAMFQSVMNDEERHDIGAHYTSEQNILKLIHPLFLDGLREEFNAIKQLSPASRRDKLIAFHEKTAGLKFLDPACGCGNFLVISYRELRLLEFDILELLLGKEKVFDIHNEIKVNVNQFYGIEIEEFPAQIAQAAMWLVDHQMNMLVRERFGEYFIRIPLTAEASIHCANSLRTDWESVIPKNELNYILGNPPFLGARVMNKTQKSELVQIFDNMKDCANLDYVTCWYKKAAQYIQGAASGGTEIEAAFVSTNSICQGLQVPVLWPELFYKHGIKINFAHQTFKWSNEARGKAAVYCVIVGFSLSDRKVKKLYHYAGVTGEPVESIVNHINPYLVDTADIFIESRNKPLCDIPPMNFGNMPADGGELLFTSEEKNEFLSKEPEAAVYFRGFISANEFINNKERWCLWLADIDPGQMKKLKHILRRVDNVKKIREASARPHLADTPYLFAQITQPMGKDFILIP